MQELLDKRAYLLRIRDNVVSMKFKLKDASHIINCNSQLTEINKQIRDIDYEIMKYNKYMTRQLVEGNFHDAYEVQ